MKPAKKETYHHGDLRTALVALALERVRKGGAESFSLREAARDAGVTSGAAYKHFADKDELLAAVAAEALTLLAQRSQKATSGLKGKDRLHASAMAYIDFAAAEPRLFRLAFSRFGSDGKTEKDGVPGAFDQLRLALGELQSDPAKPVDLRCAGAGLGRRTRHRLADQRWYVEEERSARRGGAAALVQGHRAGEVVPRTHHSIQAAYPPAAKAGTQFFSLALDPRLRGDERR